MNSRRCAARTSSSRSPRTSHRRHPPSTIAATIARSRCERSAAVRASTSAGAGIRGNVRGARTSGTPCAGRCRSRRVGRPPEPGCRARHRGRSGTRTTRRSWTSGAKLSAGTPRRGYRRQQWLRQWVRQAPCAGALSGDEPQHIGRRDPLDRLAHDREEDLQVEPRRQHRVRSAPRCQELEIQQLQPSISPRRPRANTSRSSAKPGLSPNTDSVARDPHPDTPWRCTHRGS